MISIVNKYFLHFLFILTNTPLTPILLCLQSSNRYYPLFVSGRDNLVATYFSAIYQVLGV